LALKSEMAGRHLAGLCMAAEEKSHRRSLEKVPRIERMTKRRVKRPRARSQETLLGTDLKRHIEYLESVQKKRRKVKKRTLGLMKM